MITTPWISVTERLPEPSEYPFAQVLVWVVYKNGDGRVMIADVCKRYRNRNEETDRLEYLDGFNFQWGGGDNDRTWPQKTGFLGQGGYGIEDGEDRVTHWMPLPEMPQ